MLSDETIAQRIIEMAAIPDPSITKWAENCEGSRKALVIFLGPSPGGKKDEIRREIKKEFTTPLWGKSYMDPLEWSIGFRVSFRKIVEVLFNKPYEEASKLIARFNFDWLNNPKSFDVHYHFMWEGSKFVIPAIMECNPDLLIPMDAKTFGVLQIALSEFGYAIILPRIGEINILIFKKNGKAKYHHDFMAFKAIKDSNTIIVIKSWQHPARIFNSDYAERIGKSIRSAAEQMEKDQVVNISN
jgi:hypothetical protein